MAQYFTIYTIAEFICFLTALFCLNSTRARYWRIAIPFMLLTCFVETVAIPLKAVYKANPIPQNSNVWLYNIFLIAQIWYHLTMFYNLIGKYAKSKAIILTGWGLLLLLYCYELLTSSAGFFIFTSASYSTMSVLLIIYSLYYYYLLLKSEEYTDLKFSAEFWWVTGTLFYFFGTTAHNLFYSQLAKTNPGNRQYLGYINNVLIVILYGCWSYAFLCKKWTKLNK